MSARAPKYVFITGGVVSALGKGIVAASLGRLLKARGLRVQLQKFDPYLNVDPGTMSPFQHGEVYVTEDGAETDLDIGHYERFVDENFLRNASHSAGAVWDTVLRKERKGDFLGATVQVIPHITNEIKARIQRAAESGPVDVVISEIGGTVGDIESLPFLEAIRQFRREVGQENVMYIHVTLVPFIEAAGELKTKPTQHSVNELRRIGIHPDVVVCRSHEELSRDIRDKIALFADVDPGAVIACRDMPDVYLVPGVLKEEGLDRLVCAKLGLETPEAELGEWEELTRRIDERRGLVEIALVGKYVKLQDAYLSVHEALKHAGLYSGCAVRVRWVDAEHMSYDEAAELLETVDGVLVPGGFGSRGWEGKILACRVARERGIPYLGICLGMHVAVSEIARHVVGLDGANSTEMDPETPYPVIDLLPEQKGVEDLGGTMRLGAQAVEVADGTRARELYGDAVIFERHRHRYEVNNHYRQRLLDAGLVVSGTFEQGRLVEIIELPGPPVVRRQPVPPGVQVAADAAGAALPRLRRRRTVPRALPRRRRCRHGLTSPPRRIGAVSAEHSEIVSLFLELAAMPSPPGEEREVADVVLQYLARARPAAGRGRCGPPARHGDGKHLRPPGADRAGNAALLLRAPRHRAAGRAARARGRGRSGAQRRRDDPRRRQQSGRRRRCSKACAGCSPRTGSTPGSSSSSPRRRRWACSARPPSSTTRLHAHIGYVYDQAAPIGEIILGAPWAQALDVTLSRPSFARRHVPRRGTLGRPGRREGDRRPAARPGRRGDDGERRRRQRRLGGEHRPGVVHLPCRGPQP